MTQPVGPSAPKARAQQQADAKFVAQSTALVAEDLARVAELIPGVKVSGLSVTVRIGKDEAKVVQRGGPKADPLASYPTAQEARAKATRESFDAMKKGDMSPIEAKAWGVIGDFLDAGLKRGASAEQVEAAARKGLASALRKNPEAKPFVDAALARVHQAYELNP